MKNKIKKSLSGQAGLPVRAGILIAFAELFLKSSGVQKFFKKRLMINIQAFLQKSSIDFKAFAWRERFFIETNKTNKALKIINNIFGISWFSQALFFERAELKDISCFVAKNYASWIKKNETFAIRLQKGEGIKESSREIIEKIAGLIKRKVDLDNPKKEVFIEARKQGWFVYFKKKKGKKGLPIGVSGQVLTLISGGIDSPAAAYLIAGRGGCNIWLHFHSFPLVSKSSIDKVKDLARVFLNFQNNLKVYFFPFSKIQSQIKTNILPKYRILLYRRAMFSIAQQIAEKENCKALITGESLGQVSSQTLSNIKITNDPVSIPVLRPLIGFNKEEIIKLAKKIKTFQISIRPQEDCCTLFTPKRATAEAKLNEIKQMEKRLNLKKTIEQSFKDVEVIRY